MKRPEENFEPCGAPSDESGLSSVETAIRGLFGRDSLYSVLWAVQLVAAALLTPIMTRALDATEFGTVAASVAVMQIAFTLAGLGLHSAIQRQFAAERRRHGSQVLIGSSILAATVVTLALALTKGLWAERLGFEVDGWPAQLAVLWAGVSAVTNSALALLRSEDRLAAFAVVTLLQSVVAEAASLVLVLSVDATATAFLLGQLALQIIAAAVALVWVPPRRVARDDGDVIRRALHFSLPLVPAALFTFVLNSADRLIIQSLLGPEAVGRYQIAYNVGALPMLLLAVLNSSWMPRVFALERRVIRDEVLARSRDLLYRLLVPVLVGMSAAAPLVLQIWAPQSYRPQQLLVVNALILITAIPYTAALSATRLLMSEGRTVFIASAQGVAAFVNISLNFLLIPLMGLEGAALGTLLSLSVLHLLLVARARHIAVVARPAQRLVIHLVIGVSVAIGWALIPSDGTAIARAVVSLGALTWFAAIYLGVRRISRPPHPTALE